MSFFSKAADLGQRVVVLGLVGGTGFLAWTTVNQGRYLYERRKEMDAKVKEMLATGEITEAQIKDGSLKGKFAKEWEATGKKTAQ